MADEQIINLSISGCGFLGIYNVGAACCIKQYAPQLFKNKIGGASAGALVSCAIACDCCLGECASFILHLAAEARKRALGPFHPTFDIIGHLRSFLEEILPIDAHIRCTGRLFITVTRMSTGIPTLLSNFSTREHLIQALVCSAFIPPYSGLLPQTYEGIAYVDGGFTCNLPIFKPGTTITVCPFAGESDICPRDSASIYVLPLHIMPAHTPFLVTDDNIVRWLGVYLAPDAADQARLCHDGYRDAYRFLKFSGYIKQEMLPEITPPDVSNYAKLSKKNAELLAKLHFLPPVGRYEFMKHLVNSESWLYSIFQSKSYRIFSILASPLYLPVEVGVLLIRKASRFPLSWVDSLYKKSVDHALRVLDGFYSVTSKKCSPIIISTMPDGRLICSLDVTPARLNDESAELVFRKAKPPQQLELDYDILTTDSSSTSASTPVKNHSSFPLSSSPELDDDEVLSDRES